MLAYHCYILLQLLPYPFLVNLRKRESMLLKLNICFVIYKIQGQSMYIVKTQFHASESRQTD